MLLYEGPLASIFILCLLCTTNIVFWWTGSRGAVVAFLGPGRTLKGERGDCGGSVEAARGRVRAKKSDKVQKPVIAFLESRRSVTSILS